MTVLCWTVQLLCRVMGSEVSEGIKHVMIDSVGVSVYKAMLMHLYTSDISSLW